jgi:hypothetical protein
LSPAAPAIAKVNWRVKGIASSVFVIAFSYYRAERAMIDCTQEYKERELEKMRARRDNINKGRTDE